MLFAISAVLVCLRATTAHGAAGSVRDSKSPTLKSLLLPNEKAPSILKPSPYTIPKGTPSSYTNGITYLEFYSEANCGGSLTYSTGYKADICLPANDYVRPPFLDDDDFYYKFPFQSLKISNVTESCDGWYTTYYTDVNCTDVYNTMAVDSYTDCRVATDLQISNMVSVRGSCGTVAEGAPVHFVSYVVSDYTGKEQCADSELVSFTAYGVDTCFGYGNYSSTLFSANTTSTNTIHETQFYSSANCTRSSSEYGQSDYTIAVDKCNPVQSPNAPVQDDEIAYTEFVGLSYVDLAPTAMPTTIPTARPTARPSMKPTSAGTAAPTVNDLVYFSAQQVINGISIDTYNSNKTLYGNTLALSIAACMQGVEASNIINLVATGTSSGVALRGGASSARVLASSSAISTSYDVSVRNAALTYDSLSQQLTTAVTTGQFDTYLADTSATTGATGFDGATSDQVTTENLQGGDDSKKKMPGGVIAGIVLGTLAVILLIALGLYFACRHRVGGASGGPGPARADPAVAVAEDGTTRISYEDPAAMKNKHASAPAATLNPIGANR